MTNYEKYAGTMDRFADFIASMDCERGTGEELTHQFCRGECCEDDEDADCEEDNLKKCIITWLKEEVGEKCL